MFPPLRLNFFKLSFLFRGGGVSYKKSQHMTPVLTYPPPPDCRLKDSFFSLECLYLRLFRVFPLFSSRGKNASLFALFCLLFCFPANAFACGGNAHFPPIGFSVLAREYSAESVTCKYCGRSASSAKQLSALGVCPNSPSKKHVAQRGRKTRQIYVCRYCGFRANSIRTLTASPCRANPNGSRHVAAD